MDGTGGTVSLRLTGETPGSTDGNRLHTLYYDIMAEGRRAGTCELRPEETWAARWSGQAAYTVFPQYRGHHYALSALRLMCEEAAALGLTGLIVTCRPENAASRRILELAGAVLEGTETVPPEHPLRASGIDCMCIYRIKL